MGRQTYAEKVNKVKLMLSGLTANKEKLARRGLDDSFIESLTASYESAIRLDNEQEGLKARLKEKTSELDSLMKELEKKHSESKKIVKIDIPKESWIEFGINDKM